MNEIEYLSKKCNLYKDTLTKVTRHLPEGVKLWQHRIYQIIQNMNKQLKLLEEQKLEEDPGKEE